MYSTEAQGIACLPILFQQFIFWSQGIRASPQTEAPFHTYETAADVSFSVFLCSCTCVFCV